ncbi:MAG: hypothetical protein EBT06_00955 [Gammaproteobacteria bacterium]|jgi:hypothetical protein|nr:hypothetical protein [Gammaproteobacteria bacterium]NBT43491.1 hypothetical protein [Gammaproteobacteria bacterium]NBY23373.1 hypothetical protein [Gammaproteobacteria bacterium]NDE34178.1 hypothetical protein [Gammaproteobacteria bacterium]NDE56303.1 hypothetical protein [Gammaproteobacteria bacterium]
MALRFPLGLLGLLLISGCSQEFVLSNSTPSFAEGYRAGCKSGSSVASNMTGEIIKDDKRYLNDAEYATGWREGDRACHASGSKVNPNQPMEQIEIDGPLGGVY